VKIDNLLSLVTDKAWRIALEQKVPKETFLTLTDYLNDRIEQGAIIYPQKAHWFRAINELPLTNVRVIIIGQDPYHGEGQAQGLSFSVPDAFKLPPSLRNIFKELESDCGINNVSGDLIPWVQQGVLCLNATLTVEQGKAGSHQKKGWEIITDAIISIVNERQLNCVFLLWGAMAYSKKILLDSERHLILTAPHPSPLSAHRGWFGSENFSKANKYLREYTDSEIDWRTGPVQQPSLF
jgi:uracil-DNA glycosylase